MNKIRQFLARLDAGLAAQGTAWNAAAGSTTASVRPKRQRQPEPAAARRKAPQAAKPAGNAESVFAIITSFFTKSSIGRPAVMLLGLAVVLAGIFHSGSSKPRSVETASAADEQSVQTGTAAEDTSAADLFAWTAGRPDHNRDFSAQKPANSVPALQPTAFSLTAAADRGRAGTAAAKEDDKKNYIPTMPNRVGEIYTPGEIAWCLCEEIRLESVRNLADSDQEIDHFNELVKRFNTKCSRYSYYDEDYAWAKDYAARNKHYLEGKTRDDWNSKYGKPDDAAVEQLQTADSGASAEKHLPSLNLSKEYEKQQDDALNDLRSYSPPSFPEVEVPSFPEVKLPSVPSSALNSSLYSGSYPLLSQDEIETCLRS